MTEARLIYRTEPPPKKNKKNKEKLKQKTMCSEETVRLMLRLLSYDLWALHITLTVIYINGHCSFSRLLKGIPVFCLCYDSDYRNEQKKYP